MVILKPFREDIGLERHFHDTRNTFATEGIRIGIPIKTISDALGHYSTAFTMDVYIYNFN